uniref:ITPR-interacting domain-containing protein n=1 Tax=Amazona collaria TaxID=241587 RepID=A0A8B9G507_9PSIT
MEATSVLSPTSWERRRAWVRQSRSWRNSGLEHEEGSSAPWDIPEPQPPHMDHVFLEGQWGALGTHPQLSVAPHLTGLCSAACGSTGTSFEDDLTLGAEGTNTPLLPLAPHCHQRQLLLHHTSSVSMGWDARPIAISEVLERWEGDAEEILYNLGFVRSEPGTASRVPTRFLVAPSNAKGIDFQLFLKAQVQRMEMEDPCLTLASRFQQVQALAATADAFFCLYSYVSRSPVQRISSSCCSRAHPDIPNIHIPTSQHEALSPVERLKKAVATMCLYASPRDEDNRQGSTTVPPIQPSAVGRAAQEALEQSRCDPKDVLEGWRRDTDTVPVCPHPGAAWGHSEPPCPHGGGSAGTPVVLAHGDRDAPCPPAWEEHGPDTAAGWEWGTSAPALHPHSSKVWVPPQHPLDKEDSGFSSGSYGTPLGWKAGSHGCHTGATLHPDTPRAGGHWAWSRGQHWGGQRDTGMLPAPQHPTMDSFEMEEVRRDTRVMGWYQGDGGIPV